MSGAQRAESAGVTVTFPPGEVTVTDDGERVRATWWPRKGERIVGLFRVATADRVAILQHVRRVCVYQRGETGARTDPNPTLADVPDGHLAVLRDLGFEPVEEGPR